jgi:hypothetical protein
MKIGIIGTGGAGLDMIAHAMPNHEIIQIEESEVNLVQPSDFATPILITNPYGIEEEKRLKEQMYIDEWEGKKKHRKGGNNRKQVKRKKARNGKR